MRTLKTPDACQFPEPLVWNSPSENSHGSMPIGNGDIGANVWVEASGDLVLLLSKTDAWDEIGRLCKLGRIIVKLPLGNNFRQELRLADGEIYINTGIVSTRIWIDANQPLVHVEMDGENPFNATIKHDTWRTRERVLEEGEERSAWGFRIGYFNEHLTGIEPRVYPDTILENQQSRIVFFHRNPTSVWPVHMELQGMDPFNPQENDPLKDRTFGGLVFGENLVNVEKDQLLIVA